MDEREGEISRIPSKVFCLTVPKKAVWEPFSLPAFSSIEKVYASDGMSGFSVEIFLSHSTETFRRGSLLCCVSENFW